jgi:c(7)-type cytochrome triheme protein
MAGLGFEVMIAFRKTSRRCGMKKRGYVVLLLSLIVSAFFFTGITRAEYGDIVLDNKIESMKLADVKPVMFPHWFHRIRFKCKVCHEDIFILRAGANDINMNKIMNGEFCGKCHNGMIAWEPLYCDRCHSYEGK